MKFEIGLTGLGLLIVLALVFGVIAQVVLGKATTRWLWLIGAVAWFGGGLFLSEVVYGTMTADDLQPIIDGLAFDEALLGGLLLGVPAVVVTWFATRRRRLDRQTSP